MKFSTLSIALFTSLAVAETANLKQAAKAPVLAHIEARHPAARVEEETITFDSRAATQCQAAPRPSKRGVEEEVEDIAEREFDDDIEGLEDLEDLESRDADFFSEEDMLELTERDELEERNSPYCAVRGILTRPGMPVVSKGITAKECATRCLCPSTKCRTISFVVRNSRNGHGVCRLYNWTLKQQGFKPNPRGQAVYYNRNCYKRVHSATPTGPVHTNGPRAAKATPVAKRSQLGNMVVDALAGLL